MILLQRHLPHPGPSHLKKSRARAFVMANWCSMIYVDMELIYIISCKQESVDFVVVLIFCIIPVLIQKCTVRRNSKRIHKNPWRQMSGRQKGLLICFDILGFKGNMRYWRSCNTKTIWLCINMVVVKRHILRNDIRPALVETIAELYIMIAIWNRYFQTTTKGETVLVVECYCIFAVLNPPCLCNSILWLLRPFAFRCSLKVVKNTIQFAVFVIKQNLPEIVIPFALPIIKITNDIHRCPNCIYFVRFPKQSENSFKFIVFGRFASPLLRGCLFVLYYIVLRIKA